MLARGDGGAAGRVEPLERSDRISWFAI